jgi:hypothetical protein
MRQVRRRLVWTSAFVLPVRCSFRLVVKNILGMCDAISVQRPSSLAIQTVWLGSSFARFCVRMNLSAMFLEQHT